MTPRDVYGNPQARAACDATSPRIQRAARLHQHPAPQLDDLAAFLGNRDELIRHQDAGFGVPPANQRLHTEQASRAEVYDGLIFEEELLFGERASDIRL